MLAAFSAIGTDTFAALTSALSALGGSTRAVRKDLTDDQRERADAILAASDLQDAREAIDEWVTDVTATVVIGTGGRKASATALADAPSKLEALADEPLDRISLRRTLGDAPLAVVEEGQEHLADLLRMLAAFISDEAAPSGAAPQQQAAKSSPSSLQELIYGDVFPVAVRRSLIGVGRSFAAGFAITRAEERGKRLEPWLALHLAETFKDGFARVTQAIVRFAQDDMSDIEGARIAEAARKRLLDEWWAEPSDSVALG